MKKKFTRRQMLTLSSKGISFGAGALLLPKNQTDIRFCFGEVEFDKRRNIES
jgi:hypothetical protein